MPMDPILAELYGTNRTPDADDLEKMASAELAQTLASEGGLNVGALTEDQIEELAAQVLAEATAEQTTEPEVEAAPTEEAPTEVATEEDEVLAKVAMADKLGRVMAHSMWQELGSIKEAADPLAAANGGKDNKSAAKSLKDKAGKMADKAGKAVGKGAQRVGWAANNMGRLAAHGVKSHPKASAGALAVGGGGLIAKKLMGSKKEKKASALDTLAEARALEILEASGIDPASLKAVEETQAPVAEGTEKQASETDPQREALVNAVDERAWALLAQYGVVPEETETVTE